MYIEHMVMHVSVYLHIVMHVGVYDAFAMHLSDVLHIQYMMVN